jgi:type I restriction enzyme R subunit
MLRYGDTIPLAIVEAKKYQADVGKAISQVKEYAERLQVPLAYATNGRDIIEINMITGHERRIEHFPHASEIWESRFKAERLSDDAIRILTQQSLLEGDKGLRYYQEIAVNSVIEAISNGQKRMLLTMATGTGKTFTAFQICWKLKNAKWNASNHPNRKPRILFLADRNVLVDAPKDKTFTPFGDARHKITRAEVTRGREMYFALYQSMVSGENIPPVYEQYSRDFFDLVIVDEAHRGSANDASTWRNVLNHFAPAYHLGLTATPRRDDNVDTYDYFGNPLYEYSLRQGIEDGYLAPYTVHRVITNYDRDGWRPSPEQTDRYGNLIPDREYTSADFDNIVSITPRTLAIAKHLTQFLKDNKLRDAKTIVFCVDQEHADEMRRALQNEKLG